MKSRHWVKRIVIQILLRIWTHKMNKLKRDSMLIQEIQILNLLTTMSCITKIKCLLQMDLTQQIMILSITITISKISLIKTSLKYWNQTTIYKTSINKKKTKIWLMMKIKVNIHKLLMINTYQRELI